MLLDDLSMKLSYTCLIVSCTAALKALSASSCTSFAMEMKTTAGSIIQSEPSIQYRSALLHKLVIIWYHEFFSPLRAANEDSDERPNYCTGCTEDSAERPNCCTVY